MAVERIDPWWRDRNDALRWPWLCVWSAVALLVTFLVSVRAPQAQAWPAETPHPATVSADRLPTVQIDGVVWDQAIVGDTVYVGGSFANARPAGAGTASNVPRANILAYNITTGALVNSFAPNANGQVRTITASPDGSRIYVGGDFTQIAGVARSRIAAFSTATGQLISGFAPNVGYHVYDISVSASTVYVGGNFLNVGSQYRGRLAAFTTSGALLSWAPDASDRTVWAVQVSPNGSQVAVAGAFESLNGTSAFGRGFAVVDSVTGAIQPFAMTQYVRNGGPDGAITELYTDGDLLYGSGYTFGRTAGTLEGVFAAEWGNGAVRWISDCHGDTHAVHAQGDVVYAVGHPHYCGNIDGFGQPDGTWDWYRGVAITKHVAGTIRTERLGYTDFAGLPRPDLLNFFPALNAGTYTGLDQGPWDVTGDARYIVMGGEFTTVNGTAQQGLVRFAVRASAPNAQGPQLFNTTYPIRVRSMQPGTVTVSWRGNRDRDDSTLRYRVYRRTGGTGNGTLVHTRTLNAPWWDLPVMTWTDPAASGSGYEYRVQVDDQRNNVANSPWTTVSTASTASDYMRTVLASEPDSLWRLGEAGGATAAADTVGWGDGALTSVTLGETGAILGDADTAARFSGNSTSPRMVSNQRDVTPPHIFSIEAWIRTTSSADGGLIIGYNNATTATGHASRHDRVLYMDTSGRLRFGVNPTTPVAIGPNTDYRDDQWHHVVGTLGADGMKLYIDGAVVDQRADVTSARTGYTGVVRIGSGALDGFPGTNTTTGRRFEGYIDEAAVYRRALSPSQVLAHYAASGRGTGANRAPIASFTATPDLLAAAFDGSASTDVDGSIARWAWSFGDGATSTQGPTTSHTYAAAGTYPVSLTVTDDDGATSTPYTRQVTVVAPPPANAPPVASFTAAPDGLGVALNGSASSDPDGTIARWAWSFGDGATSTQGPTTSHTYAAAGTYPVSLTVTDDDGATSTPYTRQVTVSAAGLMAADGFERTVASGWGSADIGGAWVLTGTAGNFAVAGGGGTIVLPSAGVGRNAYLNSVSAGSADISAQWSADKAATGGGTFVSVAARRVTSPEVAEYRAKLQYLSTGSLRLFLTRVTGTTETTIASLNAVPGLTVAGGDTVRIRFQLQGASPTQLRARVWLAGQAEPGTWQLSGSDSTAALQGSGGVGFVTYLSGSATNAPHTLSFDNLAVSNL